MKDSHYIGTELKFLISIKAQGFSMDDDDYTIMLKCRNQKVVITKEDIITDGQDNHYLCVDSSQFGPGLLQMVVSAEVPDSDFPDGYRTEVAVVDLCELKRT